MGLALASAIALLTTIPAQAQNLQSLQFTNNIGPNVTNQSGYPSTTNGYGNGVGVAIFEQDHLGVCVQGQYLNSGAATVLRLDFVTAMCATQAPVYNGTNYNDWSTNVNTISIALPAATAWTYFNFQTNFAGTSIPAEANFIGIVLETNGLAGNNYLTNVVISVNKKIKPFKLHG